MASSTLTLTMGRHQSPWESGEWTAIVDSVISMNAIVDRLRGMTLGSRIQNEQDNIKDDVSDIGMDSGPDMDSDTANIEPMLPDWQLIEQEYDIERASLESPAGPSALNRLIDSSPTVTEFLRAEIGYDPLVDGVPENAQTGDAQSLAPAIENARQQTEEDHDDSESVSEAGNVEESGLEPLGGWWSQADYEAMFGESADSVIVHPDGTAHAYSTGDSVECPETAHLPTWSHFHERYLEYPELPTAALKRRQVCAICQESFRKVSSPPTKLPCSGGHPICIACATLWFKPTTDDDGQTLQQNNTCPECREKLFKIDRMIPIYYD